MNKPIPEGYWENASGAFVPEANVKEIDKLRDQTVRKLHEKAKEIHELLKDFKIEGFADIASFIQISTDQYGAKVGGNKGNVTLMSYDGRLKIQRNIASRKTSALMNVCRLQNNSLMSALKNGLKAAVTKSRSSLITHSTWTKRETSALPKYSD